MEDIRVSIIIPVYNTSKYLRQCLDSIINQTLKNIEIICIDDGSDDNSLEILEEYRNRDNRVRILTQKHKKQGAARNYGIKMAKGEYVGFVDSDDWCEHDMYEMLYKKAKETDSDITMCAATTYNDNNSGEFSRANTYNNLDIFPKAFFEGAFSPDDTIDFLLNISTFAWNKIIRRDFLLDNNIYFPEEMYYEDGAFFYDSWLKAKRISLIKHFGYYYRMYSDTSTCFSNDFNKLHNFRALRDKKCILKKHGVYNRIKKDFIANKRKSIVYWMNKIEDKRAKFLYILNALVTMPSCFLAQIDTFRKELGLLIKLLFSKDKKIAFWGASIFLENFISRYHIKDNNIVGIIDKNPAKNYKKLGKYTCYPPEKLKELGVDMTIISITNFSKNNRQNVREFLTETNQENVELESV